MNDLHTHSITALLDLLNQKKITSVDIVNSLFNVIDKNDEKIGAYLYQLH